MTDNISNGMNESLVSQKEMAALLGISASKVLRKLREGTMLAPDESGTMSKRPRRYWTRDRILTWKAAGCPVTAECGFTPKEVQA